MNRLQCLIVDDEPVARKVLREFVSKLPWLEYSGEAESASRAAAFLRRQPADLIFLDIQMPRLSGMDWLRLTPVRPMVIITTAYREYALDGYELDIIDYLLKPVSFDRFEQAALKAKAHKEPSADTGAAPETPWVFVRTDKKIEKIEWRAIRYIESMGNYVKIHLDNQVLVSHLTLKSIEQQMPAHRFIKIHHSYLVNIESIRSIEGNQLHIGKTQLPVSRNYKDALMHVVSKNMLRR